MIARTEATRYAVRLSVARRGGSRVWGISTFERALAAQESGIVIAPRMESESRRGRDYVRVALVMTVAGRAGAA